MDVCVCGGGSGEYIEFDRKLNSEEYTCDWLSSTTNTHNHTHTNEAAAPKE